MGRSMMQILRTGQEVGDNIESLERFNSVDRDALDLNFKSTYRWQWCVVIMFVFNGFRDY
jgi:hypothetical protein